MKVVKKIQRRLCSVHFRISQKKVINNNFTKDGKLVSM